MKVKNPHKLEEDFEQEYRKWKEETCFLSHSMFDNSHFENIINMGVPVVPFIMKKLKEEPSFLVHALDKIYPGLVSYGEGYISCQDAINMWETVYACMNKGYIKY